MRSFTFSTILAVSVAWIHPAVADDRCPRLTLISSNEMHIGNDGRIYLESAINGTQKSMLIDTGGFFTEITQPAADELKLNTHRVGLQLIGVSGKTTDQAARASFKLGNLSADSMDFMVMPAGQEFASDIPDAVGILAPNILRSYDLDLDFGGKKLNLISQDHCDGQVVYWPADAVAVVPIQINSSGHIIVPVVLDGHPLKAMLDTGSSGSVLNLGTAQLDLKVTPGAPDTPVTGHMGGDPKAPTYTHKFKSLEFAGITVGNLQMDLIPDLMGPKILNPADSIEGGTRIPDPSLEVALPQVIIGMNVLHRLHVYIAYKERKLYVTPAGPTPASAATTQSLH